MSRKLVFRVLLLVVFVAAMLVAPARLVQAYTSITRFSYKIPIDYTMWVDCVNNGAGDMVHLTGVWHDDIKTMTNPLDANTYIFTNRGNYMGTSAVSLATGMKYQVSGRSSTQEVFKGYPGTVTTHYTLSVVGPGKNNYFRVVALINLTFYENGVVVVNQNDYNVSCTPDPYPYP